MPSPRSTPLPPAYPAVSDPGDDLASLRATVMQLKEAVELLTGQRVSRGTRELSVQGTLEQVTGLNSEVYEQKIAVDGIAQNLTLVQATASSALGRANDVSASGQMVLRAEGAPGGYKAYFGVYLKASNDSSPGAERRAGFNLGLSNADGATAIFEVNQFILRDPNTGTAAPVFSYSAGLFELNGNMRVHGSLMVDGTFTTAKYGDLSMLTDKINYNATTVLYQGGVSGSWSQASLGWTTVGQVNVAAPAGASGILGVAVDASLTSVQVAPGGYQGGMNIRVIDDYGNVWLSQPYTGSGVFRQRLLASVPNGNNYYFQVELTSNGGSGYQNSSVSGLIEVLVNKR